VGTHTIIGSFIHCLEYGQSLNFATINVIWCYPVSGRIKQRVTNIKVHPRKEEFHMDGDSIKYHVLTIFGKLWAG